MKSWALAGLLVAAMPLMPAPVAAQNWNAEYAETGKGHRVGNPDAPLQLIEFVSYTCPHCAHFERDAEAELRYFYVHEGHAAVEVRHTIRNIVDLSAALVTECGPAENFFDNHRIMLHAQDAWLARGRELSDSQMARWQTGNMPSRLRAIADDLEFYELMEPRGYSISQLAACLSDEAKAQALASASQVNGEEFAVPGTPSFVLNGTLLEGVHSWPALQQVLSAARDSATTGTQ